MTVKSVKGDDNRSLLVEHPCLTPVQRSSIQLQQRNLVLLPKGYYRLPLKELPVPMTSVIGQLTCCRLHTARTVLSLSVSLSPPLSPLGRQTQSEVVLGFIVCVCLGRQTQSELVLLSGLIVCLSLSVGMYSYVYVFQFRGIKQRKRSGVSEVVCTV